MLERVWRKGNLLTLLVGVYIERATIENSMQVLKRLKIELPYDPAISLLGTNSEETIIQNTHAPKCLLTHQHYLQ